MTKARFWKTDWIPGVAVVVSVALFNRLIDLIQSCDRDAYAFGVVTRTRGAWI
jgi:hypothetical protein